MRLEINVDNTCILFGNQKRLNADFKTFCEWFKNNKLFIHFCEDKTKLNLFQKRNLLYPVLNIFWNEKIIGHYSAVKYIECLLNGNTSGESMAKRTLKNYWKHRNFFTASLSTLHTLFMLCNDLIQKHFDFACFYWYPKLPVSLKTKLNYKQLS